MIINTYTVQLLVSDDTSDYDQEVLHESIRELYLDDHIQDAVVQIIIDQGLKNIDVTVIEPFQ